MSVELVNPDIDRVDAVNGPATGIPFLMFKSAEGGPAEGATCPSACAATHPGSEHGEAPVAKSAEEAPAEEVAKAADDAEAPAEDAAEEVAKSEEPAAEAPAEEVVKSEAEDADKAAKAAKTLAALRQVVQELGQSEAAEEDYSSDAFDLMDAGAAIDYALAILAKFALTEAVDAATVEKDAAGIRKALHLEVHEKPEADAAPAEAPAEAPAMAEAPTPAAAEEHAPAVAKATDGVLPSGLMELLSTFVEGYSHYMEAKASGAEEELTAEDAAPAPAEAPKAPAPAPAESAHEPAAPAAHEAPAAPAHAPVEAPAEPAAAEAPKAPEEDPAEKLKKSMEDAIAEAVAKATEPLLKQIDVLERTPVDSGPMLAGQTPDNAGTPLVRGQEGGAVAKGLTSASAQAAPGTNALADGIKAVYQSIR